MRAIVAIVTFLLISLSTTIYGQTQNDSSKIKIQSLDSLGELNWYSNYQVSHKFFVVKQLRWNKWITVASVKFKTDQKQYNETVKFHSGTNTFRVCNGSDCSEAVLFEAVNNIEPFLTGKVNDTLFLENEVNYKIFDSYGSMLLEGHGSMVDVSNLKKGLYYLNSGDKHTEFSKQ
jgi:hypothetical protein